MKTPEPMILNTSGEAAQLVTVTGWRSRNGHFYGDNERTARYDGCTHVLCECGAPTERSRVRCPPCQDKAEAEAWAKLPLVEWDGRTPLCVFQGDTYFFDLDDIEHHCDEFDIKASELRLVVCDPQPVREVDSDYWCDELAEDGELPPDIQDALNAFNAVIRAHKQPLSWFGGKQRVVLEDFPETAP